jgi:shikimate kinase
VGTGRHLLLIGEMGSGKTTIGEAVAERLGLPLLDSDRVLEQRTGETGSSIADRDGVDRLHELELEIFLDMVAADQDSVIAPASSVIDSERARKLIADHYAVWIDADDEVLVERHRRGSHRRLVHPVERRRLRETRGRHYEQLSHDRVDTGRQSVEESVDQVIRSLDARAG